MAELAGKKIQIMDGNGSNLFPRNRTNDIVDKSGNAVFDDNQQIKPAYLPSYVDDVLDIHYLGTSNGMPTFASATHAGKYLYYTGATAGSWTQNTMYYGAADKWIASPWETGKIYVNSDVSNGIDTYRWTGTAPVKITQLINSTANVRPYTATGTPDNNAVPTELAVKNALDIINAKAGVVTVKASNGLYVSGNVSSGNVIVYGSNATTAAKGVVQLANIDDILLKPVVSNTMVASTDVVTVGWFNDLVRVTQVTSVYATAASAIAQTSNIPIAHAQAGKYVATADGNVYKLTSVAAATSSVLVASGVGGMIVNIEGKWAAAQIGTAWKPLLTSADASTVAGSAASVTNNNNGTVTIKIPTSGAYAASAGAVAWGSVTGKPNIVNSVTSNGDGIRVSPTTGNVVIYTSRFKGADGTNAGSSGMVPAPAKTDNTKFLKGDGTWGTPDNTTDHTHANTKTNGVQLTQAGSTWTARADLATATGAGTVLLANIDDITLKQDAKATADTKSDVITAGWFNDLVRPVQVTSVYATSASAVTGIASIPVAHASNGKYVVAADGAVYKLVVSGTATSSVLVGTGVSGMIVNIESKWAAMQSNGVFIPLLTSVKAGTVGGSTPTVTNNADGTVTFNQATSVAYATNAGNGGVKSLTSKTDGLALNATTGDIQISGVAMTAATANAAGKLGMVQAPAGAQGKYLRGDYTWQTIATHAHATTETNGTYMVNTNGTWTAATSKAATAKYGTVQLADTADVTLKPAVKATADAATDVVTVGWFNDLVRVTEVTSVYATSGSAVLNTSNIPVAHADAGKYIATADGAVYKLAKSGSVTSQILVGTGISGMIVNIEGKWVAAQTGGAWKPLLTSAGATTVAGNAASVTNNNNGTVTVNIPTSVASATSAGHATTAGNGGVTKVTSSGDGILVNPTTGNVVIYTSAMVGATTAAAGKSGMVPAPAKGSATRYLRCDGTWQVPPNDNSTDHGHANTKTNGVQLTQNGTTWTARADLATDAAAGTVVIADITDVKLTPTVSSTMVQTSDVVPVGWFNDLVRVTEVTSVYATSASAVTAIPSIPIAHAQAGKYVATADGAVYKLTSVAANTSAVQVATGVKGMIVNIESKYAAIQSNNAWLPLITSVKNGGNITCTNDGAGNITISTPANPTAATVAETSTGTNTAKFVTPSAYAGMAATTNEALTSTTETRKYITPSAYAGTRMENFAVTGTTSAGVAAATSKQYVPTVHAIMDKCLFYSTITEP